MTSLRKFLPVLIFLSLIYVGMPSISSALEVLNPPGNADVTYNYTVRDNEGFRIIDVKRTVSNSELFDLTSLYLSDKLPSDLTVGSFSAEIDSAPILVFYSGPLDDQLDPSYDMHRWVIDLPGDDDVYNNVLRTGQTLILRYRIIYSRQGSITLPFHTVCFYGSVTGYFTTADAITIPAAPAEIPTLGNWGLIILALLITAAMSVSAIRSREQRSLETQPSSEPRA